MSFCFTAHQSRTLTSLSEENLATEHKNISIPKLSRKKSKPLCFLLSKIKEREIQPLGNLQTLPAMVWLIRAS